MNDTMTAATLRSDILDAGHNLQKAITTAREAAAHYVRTKHDFGTAWDAAFLASDGTEQTRKSKANLATQELSRLHDEALERKRFTRLEAEAMQSIVSAYQSIAATARQEMRWSQTGPEVGP